MIYNTTGDRMPNGVFIHDQAIVVYPDGLGPQTRVWAFARIFGGVSTGARCNLGTGAYVGEGTALGDDVRIGDGAHVTDHMRVGSRVFIAPHVIFCNDRHPVVNNHDYQLESPVVEDDVSIGVNATILPGVRLGKGCIVGAGAVVVRDVPPGVTVVGNPARELPKR